MMKSRVQYDSVNIIKIKSYSKQMAVSPGHEADPSVGATSECLDGL